MYSSTMTDDLRAVGASPGQTLTDQQSTLFDANFLMALYNHNNERSILFQPTPILHQSISCSIEKPPVTPDHHLVSLDKKRKRQPNSHSPKSKKPRRPLLELPSPPEKELPVMKGGSKVAAPPGLTTTHLNNQNNLLSMHSRRKRKIEFIENEKSRVIAFKNRKSCLMNKISQLSTLCGIDACMVIYPYNGQPEIWPPNPTDFNRVVNKYKTDSSTKQCKNICCGINQTAPINKRSLDDECMKKLVEQELHQMIANIDSELEIVNTCIPSIDGHSFSNEVFQENVTEDELCVSYQDLLDFDQQNELCVS